MYRLTPLGFDDEFPLTDGIAPYSGARAPGPQGTGSVTDLVSDWPATRPAGAREAARNESVSLPFAVGGDTYWLRRTDTSWLLRSDEESVPPDEAGAIIERAAVQYRENVPLLRLIETAASKLAGVHQGGTFVLVRLRLQVARWVPESPKPARSVPRPQSSPLPSPPALVEEVTMSAAQAAVLKEAAATGAPFCEECARAARERAGAAA
jgi:hypothetical protein